MKPIKIYTQPVPLRQNTEEKVRGKGLKAVWDDANEWSAEAVWKAEKKGPKGIEIRIANAFAILFIMNW